MIVAWLKAYPDAATRALPWPPGTRHVALEPPFAQGADPRPPSAYRALWQATGSLRALLDRAAPGWTPPVVLVGFSAAHALLEPLLRSPENRAELRAVALVDAAFGGPWPGYEAAIRDAQAGRLALVALTGTSGGDASFLPAWQAATAPGGAQAVEPRPPMPAPSRGVQRAGSAWLYRYGPELPHPSMGKVISALSQAHLIPMLRGAASPPRSGSGSGSSEIIGIVLGVLGTVGLARALRRR
jgi:hypothetical protein